MPDHTPGPWMVCPVTGNIMTVAAPHAYICKPSVSTSRAERKEKQANARLIAAAPELLAALVKAEAALRQYAIFADGGKVASEKWKYPAGEDAADEARVALAKQD